MLHVEKAGVLALALGFVALAAVLLTGLAAPCAAGFPAAVVTFCPIGTHVLSSFGLPAVVGFFDGLFGGGELFRVAAAGTAALLGVALCLAEFDFVEAQASVVAASFAMTVVAPAVDHVLVADVGAGLFALGF